MKYSCRLLLVVLAWSAALWGAQLRQVAILDIPGTPGFEQAAFANGMLVLAHESSDRLDIFDPGKRRVVAQVPGMSRPHGLAVDARGGRIYVANFEGKNIAVVSSKDWKLERTIALPGAPYGLALSPDARTVFAGLWQDRAIVAVDLANADKVTANDVGGSPHALVFDNAQRALLAALQDTAEVVAINPTGLVVLKRYKLKASQPTAMVLDSGGRNLYVAVRNAVLALSAADGSELGRVAAPAGADSLWLDPASGVLYVASGGGYVNLYRTAGGLTALDEIHTEVRGHSIAYDPARKLVFLPGGREGRSKLLILRQLAPLAPPQAEQMATK